MRTRDETANSGKQAGSVHRMSAHMQAGRRSATASLRYTCANTTIEIPENISRSYANSRLIISVNRSLSACSVIQEPFPHTPELLREIFRLLCLSSSLKQSGFDDRTKTVKSENEKTCSGKRSKSLFTMLDGTEHNKSLFARKRSAGNYSI